MENVELILIILLIIGFCLLLFLILRELACWYFKINERIELQKKTNSLLEQIFKQLGGDIKYSDKDSTKETQGEGYTIGELLNKIKESKQS